MVKREQKSGVVGTILVGRRPYIIIALVGFLLYFKTLFFGFTFLDDNQLILGNFYFLRDFTNFFRAFGEDVFLSPLDAYYRPLLTISLMIDAQLGGTAPFIYHLSNVLLHLAAACLLFRLLTKLKYRRDLSLLFALLFTVHPVLTQAVAWVPGRNDSLLAVFVLAAFSSFVDYCSGKSPQGKTLWRHLLFFALALFTKETALVLPVVCVLYYCLILKRVRFLGGLNPLLAVGWGVVTTIWFLVRRAAFTNPLETSLYDISKSVFQGLPVVVQYIGKIFFPLNLSVLATIEDTTFVYGILAIFLLVALLSVTKDRRWGRILFGLFWFLLFLLPSFARPNPDVLADFFEHRIYLSLVGTIIVVLEIGLVKALDFRKRPVQVAGALLILTFSALTFKHSGNFESRISFWEAATSSSPHHPLAHRNLGAMYYLDDRLAEAEVEYEQARTLNPAEPMVHNNLGLIYAQRGEYARAEAAYKKEMEINPSFSNTYFNLGLLYYSQDKVEEALALWQETLRRDPNYIAAYKALAQHYLQAEDPAQAEIYLTELARRGIRLRQ